jgi:hypothetical protein
MIFGSRAAPIRRSICAHHSSAADGTHEHTLVDDDPQQGRLVLGKDRLPVHSRADEAIDLVLIPQAADHITHVLRTTEDHHAASM